MSPGCSDTIWFTDTPSPGIVCSGLQIDPLFFTFTLHGRRWAWPNWQFSHIGGFARHSSSRLVKIPRLDSRKMWRKDRWYILWCQLINYCCTGDRDVGLARAWYSGSIRPVPTSFLYSRGVFGIFAKAGWLSSWRLLSWTTNFEPYFVRTVWLLPSALAPS